MKDDKAEYRKLKREIKRTGNRDRRNYLKRQLRDNPAEAHWDEYDFGFNSTVNMNGQFLDNKRYE